MPERVGRPEVPHGDPSHVEGRQSGPGDAIEPRARREGLIVKPLGDELVIYDTRRNRAHCLNPAAALVFTSCDGTRSVPRIARLLQEKLSAEADETWVWLALDRLDRARLIERRAARPAGSPSRREVLRRVGQAAVLPIVASLLAPTPAMAAASCVASCSAPAGDCGPCAADGCFDCVTCVCCSGTCVPAGTCVAGGC